VSNQRLTWIFVAFWRSTQHYGLRAKTGCNIAHVALNNNNITTIIYYVDFINNVLIIFYEFVCSVSISSDLIDLLYIETFGDICGTVNICSLLITDNE
jgi:hypothetical protein